MRATRWSSTGVLQLTRKSKSRSSARAKMGTAAEEQRTKPLRKVANLVCRGRMATVSLAASLRPSHHHAAELFSPLEEERSQPLPHTPTTLRRPFRTTMQGHTAEEADRGARLEEVSTGWVSRKTGRRLTDVGMVGTARMDDRKAAGIVRGYSKKA